MKGRGTYSVHAAHTSGNHPVRAFGQIGYEISAWVWHPRSMPALAEPLISPEIRTDLLPLNSVQLDGHVD